MSPGGPVVVDTDVFSRVVLTTATEDYLRFQATLQGRPLVLAAQTVAEVRAGALMRKWGERRLSEMEARIGRVAVVPVDDEMCRAWAALKAECVSAGHALGDKIHDSDRWIAATARLLELPLASNDGIYRDAPGLTLLT
ncbi:PIN domain-containing protein [Rhabdothermincola sp.]|uniref:PIN domain-containing protein n=1 Tax=Rhabdothermincola sp. TaxID=2820405 RepID=UPI002FE0459E